jgi:hypothetical protein
LRGNAGRQCLDLPGHRASRKKSIKEGNKFILQWQLRKLVLILPALLEKNVTEPPKALTLQLLEWIADHPRRYDDALEAWRTTCPRLSIWEDACIDGLIDCEPGSRFVSVSAKGKALLQNGGQ